MAKYLLICEINLVMEVIIETNNERYIKNKWREPSVLRVYGEGLAQQTNAFINLPVAVDLKRRR